MKKNTIIILISVLLVIIFFSFVGYKLYKKEKTEEVYERFIGEVYSRLNNEDSLEDKISILEESILKFDLSDQGKTTTYIRVLLEEKLKDLEKQKKETEEKEQARVDEELKRNEEIEKDNQAWEMAYSIKSEEALNDYIANYSIHKIEALEELRKLANERKIAVNLPPPIEKKKWFSLIGLKCIKQESVIGSDEVTLKINNEYILDSKRINTGAYLNLKGSKKFIISKDDEVSVALIEIDDKGHNPFNTNDPILDFSVYPNKAIGTYSERGKTTWGGHYELSYEIGN